MNGKRLLVLVAVAGVAAFLFSRRAPASQMIGPSPDQFDASAPPARAPDAGLKWAWLDPGGDYRWYQGQGWTFSDPKPAWRQVPI